MSFFKIHLYLEMKLNKITYFSLFFLLSFLSSFSLSTYQCLNTKATSHQNLNHDSSSISQKEENSSSNSELLFEENENEVEDGFQIQAILIPCFIAYFLAEVPQPKIISAKPLAEKYTTPIYLSVCNFRI